MFGERTRTAAPDGCAVPQHADAPSTRRGHVDPHAASWTISTGPASGRTWRARSGPPTRRRRRTEPCGTSRTSRSWDWRSGPSSPGARHGARCGRRWRCVPAAWRAVRLARFVRREGIAIIHTSDRPRDAFATALIARLSGAAAVVHVHAGYDPSWMGRILRWSLRQADALVAVSHYVADHARRRWSRSGAHPRRAERDRARHVDARRSGATRCDVSSASRRARP